MGFFSKMFVIIKEKGIELKSLQTFVIELHINKFSHTISPFHSLYVIHAKKENKNKINPK